jgi:hypothetical protein
MVEPHALTATDPLRADAVQNGDPVAILVNRVLLPGSLTADGGRESRDIAVLLDFSGVAGEDEKSIAVWYQRSVPADEPLSFQNLVVYSQDSWDNRVPPFFRMRIVDVSIERNERTRELLNQVSNFGGSLAQVFATPVAGPLINLAGRAAQLVLANRENELLIDFTFNLFSSAQIGRAGGMPLGLFKRGGLLVMGLPAGQSRDYWANQLRFDHVTTQVQLAAATGATPAASAAVVAQVMDAPFMIATVLTTETVVPTVVKRRSQVITKTLSDPAVIRENIGAVIDDAKALVGSLAVLQAREAFARIPTANTFLAFAGLVSRSTTLKDPERFWALSVMRNVTGKLLDSPASYLAWVNTCATHVTFSAEERRFEIEKAPAAAPKECKK